ncbi:DNA polymerase III subunit chi [Candidatus Hartigia pinicola]|nr:DNA polymerase III subunit chi [Candidatus Hartigia pinicola]
MKNVTFYLLDTNFTHTGVEAHELLACEIASKMWRNGKRVLLACDTSEQAEKLDEALWAREPHRFIPHNLVGQGPIHGAPIVLCWPNQRDNTQRDILISLQSQFSDLSTVFYEVIDFVPLDQTLRQLARERYKFYRSIGFNVTMATCAD